MTPIVQAAVTAQRGNRAKGFYWVRHNENEWELAHWGPSDIGDAPTWIMVGVEDRHSDSDMVEIDERQVNRNDSVGLPHPFVSFASLFPLNTDAGHVYDFK